MRCRRRCRALTSYSVTLDNPVASIVLATPINDSFSFSLTVTNDNIVLLAASSITLTGDASSSELDQHERTT